MHNKQRMPSVVKGYIQALSLFSFNFPTYSLLVYNEVAM
jgi:hypothetical protein